MSAALAAALGASLILFGLAGLHAALALGAPLGKLAWGGRHRGVLPERLQLGSGLMVPALFGMAIVLLIHAGLLYPQWSEAMRWPAWGAFLFLVMGARGALRSESRDERRIIGPLCAVAALLVAVAALS